MIGHYADSTLGNDLLYECSQDDGWLKIQAVMTHAQANSSRPV